MVVDQIALRLRNNFLQGGTDFEEFLHLPYFSALVTVYGACSSWADAQG